MNIGTLSSSAVWTSVTRNLTSFNGILTDISLGATSLATGNNVDLRTASGATARLVFVAYITPNIAGAAGSINFWDGTTGVFLLTLGVNATGNTGLVLATNAVGPRIQNTGTQTNTYLYSALTVQLTG